MEDSKKKRAGLMLVVDCSYQTVKIWMVSPGTPISKHPGSYARENPVNKEKISF